MDGRKFKSYYKNVILKHFQYCRLTDKPEHFQADIEVDKWVRAFNGWLIGISCKRTLRERWKQVSSADLQRDEPL